MIPALPLRIQVVVSVTETIPGAPTFALRNVL
jgi:hypothetical protein